MELHEVRFLLTLVYLCIVFQTFYSERSTSICLNLYCQDPSGQSECVTPFAAASDGTTCEVDRFCYRGECISEEEVHSRVDQGCNGKPKTDIKLIKQ